MRNKLYTGLFMLALTSSHVMAASTTNKGETPNGKPFIEIAGQIVEVQNDIATLETAHQALIEKVDALGLDLQGKIDAINAEIVLLKAEDVVLKADVINIYNTLAEQGSDIVAIFSELSSVNNQLIALRNDTYDNTNAINLLELDRDDIYLRLAALDAGIVTVLGEITYNNNLISLVQSDVSTLESEMDAAQNDVNILYATKQTDIQNSCPAGTSVNSIDNNGYLHCVTTNQVGNLDHWTDNLWVEMDNYTTSYTYCSTEVLGVCLVETTVTTNHTRYVDGPLYCPTGYVVTGGGFDKSNNTHIDVHESAPSWNGGSWRFFAKNHGPSNTSGDFIRLYINCMKVVQ